MEMDEQDWFQVALTDAHSGGRMTYLVTEIVLHGPVNKKIVRTDLTRVTGDGATLKERLR